MGYRWYDGFDDIPANGYTSSGYASAVDVGLSNVTPHGLGQSLHIINNTSVAGAYLHLATGPLVEFLFCYHVRVEQDEGGALFIAMWENGLNGFVTQGTLILNSQRGLTWQLPNGSVAVMSEKVNKMFPGVWYWLEIKGNAATGEIEVRVNEEVIIPWQVVGGFPNGEMNIMRWQRVGGAINVGKRYDNLQVIDRADGIAPVDYVGDSIVFSGLPRADTDTNQMAIVGVTGVDPDHYLAVDEVTADNDTTYLLADEVGLEEEFLFQPLPENAMDVISVGLAYRAKKDAAGTAKIVAKMRIGTETQTDDGEFIAADYTTRLAIMSTKPGGGAWSVADYNALAGSATTAVPA